jgi:thiamine biosynthesis lipoprotein ApbE
VELVDAAFSVSDNGSQPDAPDGRHIADPRVAAEIRRPQVRRRAVVTGPSARLADAWSTAVVVLGAVPSTFPRAYDARFLRNEV